MFKLNRMIILFVWVSICSWASALPRVPRVTAKAAVVYDVNSGMYLFDKNGGVPMYPASTVKLLTAMVILDKWDPEYKISIPGSVKEIEPFKLYLKRGETYKVIDLLYALLMRSANDVAHALGVRAGGSEKRFAKLMMKTKGLRKRENLPFGLYHKSGKYFVEKVVSEKTEKPILKFSSFTQGLKAVSLLIRL